MLVLRVLACWDMSPCGGIRYATYVVWRDDSVGRMEYDNGKKKILNGNGLLLEVTCLM